jgi:hypothetical protein
MIINILKKKHYRVNGGTKYYINCSGIEKETDSLIPEQIIKNTHDVSILKAIINYSQHFKKNKNIVVKIAHKSKTNLKEYRISQRLQGIPGFIKYICLFDCFDNTYNYISLNQKLPQKICTADNIGENDNNVLVAPYIKNGSIKHHAWNDTNAHVLKSLLNQCIISLMYAFTNHGFLHNDLHLDNILFKRTKMQTIHYADIEVMTNGYKSIIMDFDSSLIGVDASQAISYFWSNMYNMLSRVRFDLKDKITAVKNFDNIILFISNAEVNKYEATRAKELISLIESIQFVDSEPIKAPVYNPYVF